MMTGRHEEDSGQIRQLLRLAGPREAIQPERTLRVRSAVLNEWRRQTRARAHRNTIVWSVGILAAAALVLMGIRLMVRDGVPTNGPQPAVATVETVSGPMSLLIGDTVRAGALVDTTAGGRAGLRMGSGAVVRVDIGSRLRLTSDSALVLDQGAVYVDSGARGDARVLEVRTRLGIARDIGTRFAVRIDASTLTVRVRDGLVELTQGGQAYDAKAGDELTLNEGGHLVRRIVPIHGADWAWAAALARPFDLEGKSLRQFLDWICEENGWQLRFANASIERKAATAILHGSIKGLSADEALAAVLPTSGVEHELDAGVLRIRASDQEP
jgi:ferric-dicitrate binding protein FerR (iron transport regulator)